MTVEICYGKDIAQDKTTRLIPTCTLQHAKRPAWGANESLWIFFDHLASSKTIKRGQVYRFENVLLVPVAIQPTAKGDLTNLEKAAVSLDKEIKDGVCLLMSDWAAFRIEPDDLIAKLEALLPGRKITVYEDELPDEGLVFYTDGGCRLSTSGVAGFGIHGYRYRLNTPKRGLGLGKIYASPTGYLDPTSPYDSETTKYQRKESDSQVCTVLAYYDGYGGVDGAQTNNRAELLGLCAALRKALDEHGIVRLHIIADSEYALKAYSNIEKACKNGWTGSSGQALANADLLEQVHNLKQACKAASLSVTIEWMRGHTGNLGNERADELCHVAMNRQEWGKEVIGLQLTQSEPGGYWDAPESRHPLLSDTRVYLLKSNEPILYAHDRYPHCQVYYTGNAGGKGSEPGVGDAERYNGIVHTNGQPDALIEHVREYTQNPEDKTLALVEVRNDILGHARVIKAMSDHGVYAIRKGQDRRYPELTCANRTIGFYHTPVMLSLHFYSDLSDLHDWVMQYRTDPQMSSVAVIDITDRVYETPVDKRGQAQLSVIADDDFVVTWDVFKIKLAYGIQFPNRTLFGRIKDLNPKVNLIITEVGDLCASFAVEVQCDTGWGVWQSQYANRVFFINRSSKESAS